MDKELFITGASGFVGQRLLTALDPDAFARITLLSRKPLALPQSLCDADHVEVVQAELSDVSQFAQRLNPATRVLHMAALTGKADPQAYTAVNTEGTRALLSVAKEREVGGFLFVSTIAVAFEDQRGYHYAHSKDAAEQIVQQGGVPFTIVRPTIVLGRGSPIGQKLAGLGAAAVPVCPGSGQAMIQPLDVDDLSRLLLRVLQDDRFGGETLDLGGPEVLSMASLLERIHGRLRGSAPKTVLHLPLGLVLPVLRLVERLVGGLLPVSSGQFASFLNDGVARDNALTSEHRPQMKGIDAMLEDLAAERSSGS